MGGCIPCRSVVLRSRPRCQVLGHMGKGKGMRMVAEKRARGGRGNGRKRGVKVSSSTQQRESGLVQLQEVLEDSTVQGWTPSSSSPGDGGRKRVVVLGSGWGAMAFCKSLPPGEGYDVTVVSPRNYFLYTPLLPGAATGAIEERSIVEPIRRPLSAKGYNFYEASCLKIQPEEKKIICRASDMSSETQRGITGACPWHTFDLHYDHLIVAVGATSNTFGVPGVEEHALFFKEAGDAAAFRREVTERFERAALPGTPIQRVRETLSFVFVGAGPTGVELAAELNDMIKDDLSKLYPSKLISYASIKIIDLMEFVLSTYDRRIAEYATEHFRRTNIDLLLNRQVVEVNDGLLRLKEKNSEEEELLPFGLCVWCTGIKLNPICSALAEALPEQDNIRSLKVDKHLRVVGSNGSIFALGDCATVVRPRSIEKAEELFKLEAPSSSARLRLPELKSLLKRGAEEFSHLEELSFNIDEEYKRLVVESGDGRDGMSFEQFKTLLSSVDSKLRSFPPTAQVAKQEGEYLASFFDSSREKPSAMLNDDATSFPSFKYSHKGSLAYVGNDSGVADIPGFTVVKGIAAGLIWKGFETISQFAWRNKFLVAADMLRAKLFGRDVSRL